MIGEWREVGREAEMEGWTVRKRDSQIHNKILREKAKYNLQINKMLFRKN